MAQRLGAAGEHPQDTGPQQHQTFRGFVQGIGRLQSRHRDGDRYGKNLRLYQDDVRDEQAVRLVEIHRRGAQYRHPRRGGQEFRDARRPLHGVLRQEGPLVCLQQRQSEAT